MIVLYIRILYIESSARVGNRKRVNSADGIRKNTAQGMLCARNHCSAMLRSHWPLEIAARACREAMWHSKSPLEHAFSCSATLANAAPALALGAGARISVVEFDNTFAFLAESLSKSLSKSLCFELCIASSCALRDSTGTVRCHMRI